MRTIMLRARWWLWQVIIDLQVPIPTWRWKSIGWDSKLVGLSDDELRELDEIDHNEAQDGQG